MNKIITLSILMALVTIPSRVIPGLFFSERKLPPLVESFLHYVPFAMLGTLVFPDILTSTGDYRSSLAGFIVAFLLSWRNSDILIVLLGAISASYIVTRFI
ncbi:MAG: AzlD domain-containing protein [Synergistaceae bacterium]